MREFCRDRVSSYKLPDEMLLTGQISRNPSGNILKRFPRERITVSQVTTMTGDTDVDWLVIGSGFGGSVSALRLAEKGYSVDVLECGRRFADEMRARSRRLRSITATASIEGGSG